MDKLASEYKVLIVDDVPTNVIYDKNFRYNG